MSNINVPSLKLWLLPLVLLPLQILGNCVLSCPTDSCKLVSDATVASYLPDGSFEFHSHQLTYLLLSHLIKKMHFYFVFHSKHFLLVLNITASQSHYRTLSNFPSLIVAVPGWRIPGFSVLPIWKLFCAPYCFFSLLFITSNLCFLRWDSGKSQFPKVFIMSVIK